MHSAKYPRRRRRGIIFVTEVLGSITLTLALVAILAGATLHYSAVRRETDARRELLLAATAELDRIRAGLQPLPRGEPEARPVSPKASLLVEAAPGTGPWAGLVRVHVTARQRVTASRVVQVELSAYATPEGQP